MCGNQEVDTEVVAEAAAADEDPAVVVVVHVDLVVVVMHKIGADSTGLVVVERAIETNGAEVAVVGFFLDKKSFYTFFKHFRLELIG